LAHRLRLKNSNVLLLLRWFLGHVLNCLKELSPTQVQHDHKIELSVIQSHILSVIDILQDV